MNIKIQKLKLTNFKCFKGENEFDFEGKDVVTIKGRNGAGKTTIADAILWCLFGKNSQGQSDFDLKTHGEDGKPIPHLDHSVELNLVCDAGYITLSRTLKETWVKKRGSEEQVFKNNTTEYLVNGDSYTAADYKKYIAGLVSEDIFRAVTNPSYFPSLKWQEQREFLSRLAGHIDIDDEDQFKKLMAYINRENSDVASFKKHVSYQIKQIKEKLDRIPVRLEEQNKALPEKLDWDNIEVLLSKTQQELKGFEEGISQIKQGNGADLKRTELRNQINETQSSIDKLRYEAQKDALAIRTEHQGKINELSVKFTEALGNQKLMEQAIQADERMIERCKEIDFEAELQKLRDQWPSSKFVIDPKAAFCPTCGQAIPDEQYQEKVEEMKRNFNLNREEMIKMLNLKASIVKKDQADAAEELKSLEQKLEEDTAKLEDIKKSLNDIFTLKAKLEKEPVTTAEELLNMDERYINITKQLSELKEALNNVTDSDIDKDKLTELDAEKARLTAEISNYQSQLAIKSQYERIQSLIEGIHEEEKNLITQLSDLESKEDMVKKYQDRQNEVLEERINEHFSLVQWKMFRTVNNGGDPYEEPYCECYVNGVAYHDGLNQAARLNAGLDIISCLCKHYNVSAPICIDNSESSLDIMQTTSQQIRLEVADTELQIL